jgi:hypothetical protein
LNCGPVVQVATAFNSNSEDENASAHTAKAQAMLIAF